MFYNQNRKHLGDLIRDKENSTKPDQLQFFKTNEPYHRCSCQPTITNFSKDLHFSSKKRKKKTSCPARRRTQISESGGVGNYDLNAPRSKLLKRSQPDL